MAVPANWIILHILLSNRSCKSNIVKHRRIGEPCSLAITALSEALVTWHLSPGQQHNLLLFPCNVRISAFLTAFHGRSIVLSLFKPRWKDGHISISGLLDVRSAGQHYRMDFATGYAANTAAKLTGHGIISYTKAYTTNGRMKRGWDDASIAIDTLDDRQKYLEGPDLKIFAERLTLLDDRRKQILEKSQQAKWPWTHFDEAKKFAKLAVQLKDNVISTSQNAMLKRWSSGEVKDDEYTDYMRNSLREVIRRLLQEEGNAAAGQSAHNDESVVDNSLIPDPTTPTNGSFPPNTHMFDDQKTPTDSVFPDSSGSIMTADSVLFPDSSSSIITDDSSRPLISPTVPSPAFQSDRGRGLFGPFARRNSRIINGYLVHNAPPVQAPSPAPPAADIC